MRAYLIYLCLVCTTFIRAGESPGEYKIQAGDLLSVEVFGQADLARQVRVSQPMTINLPLIGSILLENCSTSQLTEIIRKKYDAEYLVNPNVNVRVLEYTKRTVNVVGAVNQAGAIEIPSERSLSIIDAITKAGGFNRLANLKQVTLTRISKEGVKENSVVDVSQMLKGQSKNLELIHGDTVFVPETTF